MLIISIHIPKTAGTTFGAILQQKFKGRFLYVYNSNIPGRYCVGQTLGELNKSQSNEKESAISKPDLYTKMKELDIECIHGHFPYSFVADAPHYFDDVKYVTWIREPEARTYSDYLHFRRSGSDVSTEKLVQVLANRMTDFTGPDLSVFFFIGRTEYFDEDLKRFGISDSYKTLNTTPETKEDIEIKALIKKAVDRDKLLYDKVLMSAHLVHVYVITWQNANNLEYFIRFYRERFPNCAITVYDNGSTDETLNIIRRYDCSIIPFKTEGFDDVRHQEIKDNCWKGQKEKWAFCLDDDELLDVTAQDLVTESADIISFVGVERFNREKHLINAAYNKSVAFKVADMVETNFKVGAHGINPVARKEILFSQGRYYLIHDKYSDKSMIDRNRILNERVPKENKERKWSWHYDVDLEGYYDFGMKYGVPYEQLASAPSVDYENFKK